MSLALQAEATVKVDGATRVAADTADTSDEVVLIDQDIPENSTALALSIGIPLTSKLKYLAIHNTGAGDITACKIDGGTLTFPLASGEYIILGGPGVAKGIVDALTGALTFLLFKVTTGSGDLAHLKVVALTATA